MTKCCKFFVVPKPRFVKKPCRLICKTVDDALEKADKNYFTVLFYQSLNG